jgi:unsaturated rhamnogalacturonyl hydrolase
VKDVLIVSMILGVCLTADAQDPPETASVLRLVAGRVITEASFECQDSASGLHFPVPETAPQGMVLKLASPYNDWRYWNGVLAVAMDLLGTVLPDSSYRTFPEKNIGFAFGAGPYFQSRYAGENKWEYPFGQFFMMEELDDCGAMGAAVIDACRRTSDPRYLDYVDRVARHLMKRQTRLADGTFARNFPRPGTVWADDLYMSVPFLARMGAWRGEGRWFDEAAAQVARFHARLFDEQKEVMCHCWYADGQRRGPAFWGRANGWALLAQVDLLDRLPADHPRRTELLALLQRHLRGISRYQSVSGLWHQLLDREDSFLETSCSAMFTYAIARAVRQGYIEPEGLAVAKRGWAGIRSRIRPDGQIEGVCAGTVVSDDMDYYRKRPTPTNDVHGTGAVILAGAEMLRIGRRTP